jgi:hypothetical protein
MIKTLFLCEMQTDKDGFLCGDWSFVSELIFQGWFVGV